MAKCGELSFQQRSLYQQGYQRFTTGELNQLEWGLRFTPAVCSAITAVALYYQLPYVLLFVATLGMWAFFFPAAHPMDLIYNHGVRRLFGAVALPENPLQRRLACLSAGVMNVIAAVLFLVGLPVAALVVGGLLLVLQAIVIFTHFCTLSWMYEGVMRLLGKWQELTSTDEAVAMLNAGAVLVDVRTPMEFAEGSVRGAVNCPLEEIERFAGTMRSASTLLFCNSGMRSNIALLKLQELGVSNLYNIGEFKHAEEVAAAAS
jgi:rhodanese-related sulfurtransferase